MNFSPNFLNFDKNYSHYVDNSMDNLKTGLFYVDNFFSRADFSLKQNFKIFKKIGVQKLWLQLSVNLK